MDDIAGTGRTIVFVSHNMAAIQNLCTSAYLLTDGHVSASGPVDEVIARYLQDVSSVEYKPMSERSDRQGNGKLRFEDLEIQSAVCGSEAAFEIAYSGSRRCGTFTFRWDSTHRWARVRCM